MGAGCAPKVGPALLHLPIRRAQSTQIRSSASSKHTCSILSLHGHLAVWPCQGQPAPSLPDSSFGLFQTTSMEVRHMGRGLWVEGETPFLPGAESVAGPRLAGGFQQKCRVPGRCSQKPGMCSCLGKLCLKRAFPETLGLFNKS